MSQQDYLQIQTKIYNLQNLTVAEEQVLVNDNKTLFDCIKWIRQNLLIKEYNIQVQAYLEMLISELSHYYSITYNLRQLRLISTWLCSEYNIYIPIQHNSIENINDDIIFFAAVSLNMKLITQLHPETDTQRILAISRELTQYLDRYYKIKEQLET